ncbi:MAG: ABC transporter permease [Planctomycetota bacterium]
MQSRAVRLLAAVPLWVALAFVVAFVAAPLLVLLAQTVLGPEGFTLEAWGELLGDAQDGARLWSSMQLGLCATAVSLLLGGAHTWVAFGRDLPLGRALLPLGVVPLVVPPIFVAMGFADLLPVSGFWPCAVLLGIAHAPFVAVLLARGLRAVDGRAYESALLLRGRGRAELWLLRAVLPELLAGCLLAFLFTIADHGVPEFLTVKGKTWHTYSEGIFSRWNRRAVGTTFADLQSPITAAVPLVLVLLLLLWLALRLRAQAERGTPQPLPLRPLGRWRWPALLWPLLYLGAGLLLPIAVLGRWALGSAQKVEPMSLAYAQQSFHKAVDQGVPDLVHSVLLAAGVALLVTALALPLARRIAGGGGSGRAWPRLELLCALPVAAPAILLGIGLVRAFHDGPLPAVFGRAFYDGWGFAAAGYAARLLPFAVLPLTSQVRRLSPNAEDAARTLPRSRLARAVHVHLPPLLPAAWSAAVLVFVLGLRELDLAVVLPAANATAVRRLANAVHFQHEDWSGVIGLMLLGIAVLVPLLPGLLAGRRLSSLS